MTFLALVACLSLGICWIVCTALFVYGLTEIAKILADGGIHIYYHYPQNDNNEAVPADEEVEISEGIAPRKIMNNDFGQELIRK